MPYANLMTNNLRIFCTVSYLPLFALQGAKQVSVAFSAAQIKEEDAYLPGRQVLSRCSGLVTRGPHLRHSQPSISIATVCRCRGKPRGRLRCWADKSPSIKVPRLCLEGKRPSRGDGVRGPHCMDRKTLSDGRKWRQQFKNKCCRRLRCHT